MITIEDNDTPIVAASKIIYGTRPKTEKDLGFDACPTRDMFDYDEINEIAMYLTTYLIAHKGGD